jgi:hypothetical protein
MIILMKESVWENPYNRKEIWYTCNSFFFVDKIKRGKNQGGTPEKSATPSQDATDENQSPTRNVLWNEEIEKLQIKEDDLKNVSK